MRCQMQGARFAPICPRGYAVVCILGRALSLAMNATHKCASCVRYSSCLPAGQAEALRQSAVCRPVPAPAPLLALTPVQPAPAKPLSVGQVATTGLSEEDAASVRTAQEALQDVQHVEIIMGNAATVAEYHQHADAGKLLVRVCYGQVVHAVQDAMEAVAMEAVVKEVQLVDIIKDSTATMAEYHQHADAGG